MRSIIATMLAVAFSFVVVFSPLVEAMAIPQPEDPAVGALSSRYYSYTPNPFKNPGHAVRLRQVWAMFVVS